MENIVPCTPDNCRSWFDAAFTQSSGVISSHLDKFAFPRFALNERYGGIDRFRLIVNAMP